MKKLKDSGQFKQFILIPEPPSHYGTATKKKIDEHVEFFQNGIIAFGTGGYSKIKRDKKSLTNC